MRQSVHKTITKPRVAVFILALILLAVAISLPALLKSSHTMRQKLTNPELGLYSITDTYTKNNATYDLAFPFLGEQAFDTEIAKTANQAKKDFAQALHEVPAFTPSQLRIKYTTYFYNENYLSLALTTEQAIGEQQQTQVTTFLYDRHEQKILPLKALFAKDNAPESLGKIARTTLKKKLKAKYKKERATEYTSYNAEATSGFIIDDTQQLELVFQPDTVAPADEGVVYLPIAGKSIRDITAKKIAGSLIKLPPEPKPQPANQPASPPPPAVNLNPTPVPQADPSGVDCAVAKCVALTFDDGPKGETSTLLDILDANNAKATFFVLGLQAERYPDILHRIKNSGHSVGNHTYDHQDLMKLSVADAAGQITRTGDVIQSIIGIRPGIARAPYGSVDQQLAAHLGMPFIGWSVDTQDWMVKDAAQICNIAVNGAHPGAIILAHDIYPSSVEGFRCAIPQLVQRGFVLVTVPQLLGFGPNTPPGVYSSR